MRKSNKYTDFLSIALKQTKAGHQSSGTPFLVSHYFSTVIARTSNWILLYPFLIILFHLQNLSNK